MDKKTVDERIEELVDSYRKKLQEKKEALMTIDGPNAITLEGIE
ncbi:MAG: hypothetical protein Ta2B_15770 [Termitinemataceae bacterium]|nr:MAG: hypothetical protein Ta2B_15770 [Termitinemataceae bacterium]